MTGDLRDEVAGVLGEHVYVAGSDGRGCSCGWKRRSGDDRPLQEQWAEKHLAQALIPLLERREREAKARVADRYLTAAAQAVRLAYDEPERLGDNLISVARRIKALVDEDRADSIAPASRQYVEDSCRVCNDRHPLDGCADVGCRHNCEEAKP